MKITNVLVVDDSAFMRKVISDMLEEDNRIAVIGTARNGMEALSKIKELSPDVITLDIEMPKMNGLETLSNIKKEFHIPVVMLSSQTKEGAEKTVQAMSLGAFDFVAKPSGAISLNIRKVRDDLIAKVIAASKSMDARPLKQAPKSTLLSSFNNVRYAMKSKEIVAIGTSTGGPKALQQVLTKLPKDFAAPIVIVQHMPEGFTKSLANRLDSLSEVRVKEAVDGELLLSGIAYIAPGGKHLRAVQVGRTLVAQVTTDELVNGHRPSVDVLFESLALQTSYSPLPVIMTGMGSDGANGLRKIKEYFPNAISIAESKQTAVVYGMPQVAVKTNLVDFEVDLEMISQLLVNRLNK